jgi:cytochrome d ubiquinol oxidase subunit II
MAFELWGKRDDPAWRTRWEWALIVGSLVPALLWGVGWANIVDGVPIDRSGEFTGTLFDLLNPYALLGGLATLTLFLSHGALFLELRTKGEIRARAQGVAAVTMPVAAVICVAFLGWTLVNQGDRGGVEAASALCAVAAAAALATASVLAGRRPGRAFGATCAAIVLLFCTLFVDLFPNAMVSSTDSAFDLSLAAASSSNYTLSVMTVVAVALVPVVLLYQGWSYWVFRHRVGAEDFGEVRTPLDLVDRRREAPSGGGGASGGD